MSAQLVWATPNGDNLIAYMARVSNPDNQDKEESAPKLINYLIKNNHWSPFEMTNLCVEIETTRAISAQILRHRSFCFQEFSQRYALAMEPVIPHLRRQDLKNRQNSVDDMTANEVAGFYRRISELFEDASHLYSDMVFSGVAKECARGVLPMNTMTRLYMNGTVRSWIHYLQLRTDHSTQLEHRELAIEILNVFRKEYPQTAAAVGLDAGGRFG